MRLSYFVAKVPSGAALSNILDLRNHRLVGIHMPAAWDVAAITFAGCFIDDKSSDPNLPGAPTFDKVVDSAGTEVSITAAQGTYIGLKTADHDSCDALGRIKVRSGTAGVPVNQAADRFVVLICAPRAGAQ